VNVASVAFLEPQPLDGGQHLIHGGIGVGYDAGGRNKSSTRFSRWSETNVVANSPGLKVVRLRLIAHEVKPYLQRYCSHFIGQILHDQRSPMPCCVVYHILRGHNVKATAVARLSAVFHAETYRMLRSAVIELRQSQMEERSTYKHNLPASVSSFIGREQELREIRQRLREHRLVTLTGTGGTGKTRLALEAAAGELDQFADGVWLVELAGLSSSELVVQTIAKVLALPETPDLAPIERLGAFLQGRHLLLVLDNCEHLIEECAHITAFLLVRCPHLALLATSREPLAIGGEVVLRVPPLRLPDPTRPVELASLLRYDAVCLFVERAHAVEPSFQLTASNAETVVEICGRLDGIPLALELASARVNVLTVQEIAARLNDRFALLTSGQRSGLEPRHHTLRAAIDWSYTLLTPEEQTLLSRLAVFAAGFTLDTAETVYSGEGIAEGRMLDVLSSLVGKSLVVAETTSRAQARYRLLETICEYALEKLAEAGEVTRLRDRHLDLFLARAEAAAPKLFDAYQQLWLNWLEGEHDNIRAALAWALEGGRIEAGLRIAIALVRFWEIRGYVREGLAWFERLLGQAGEGIPLVVRASGFTFAAFLADFLGDVSSTTSYARDAVALAEAAGDEGKSILGFALGGLATNARAAGDYQTAFTLMERSVQLLRDSPWPSFHLGMAIYVQGELALRLGYYDTARVMLDESLTLAREAGDSYRIAYILKSFGELAHCEQKYAEAQIAYEQSVALLRELGATHDDLAAPLHNLGHACLHLGDVERAQALFTESMAACQAQHNPSGMIAECLIGFAALAIVHGSPAAGARLLAAAVAIGAQRAKSSWVAMRMEYEHYLALARAKLADAEFQAEQTAGRALSLEQAIEYAQNLPLISSATPAIGEKTDDLTEREREVAALIAQGKSNGEIAGELVLSKRTVEKHIANILSKLGLTSRAQLVRWAIGHGLTQASAS
jgi:predicted ATPase/DNA-binding CsgD family transcriptional regulator